MTYFEILKPKKFNIFYVYNLNFGINFEGLKRFLDRIYYNSNKVSIKKNKKKKL